MNISINFYIFFFALLPVNALALDNPMPSATKKIQDMLPTLAGVHKTRAQRLLAQVAHQEPMAIAWQKVVGPMQVMQPNEPMEAIEPVAPHIQKPEAYEQKLKNIVNTFTICFFAYAFLHK